MFNKYGKKLNKNIIFAVRDTNVAIYDRLTFKRIIMFGLFKKKTEKEKLQEQYKKLMKEAHSLSSTNRKLSDQKVFEAEEIMKQYDKID